MGAIKRKALYVDGIEHKSPIPAGCRIGNLVVTGNVYGSGPDGAYSADPGKQVMQMFENLTRILKAGESGLDDVIKISIKVRSLKLRQEINPVWSSFFPDPECRPVRQVMCYEHLPDGALFQCEAMAVLGDWHRMRCGDPIDSGDRK